MSIDALQHLGHQRHALRVALGAPCVYALAAGLQLPVPFLAPLFFVIFAVSMRTPPPAKAAIVLLCIMFVVPALFSAVSDALADHSYMLVAFIGAVLFLAYRMVFNPRTAAIGNLIVIFALIMPVLTSESAMMAGMFPAVLSFNAAIGLLSIYLAFAVFARPAGLDSATPVPGASRSDAERTRLAITATAVMIPLIVLYLSLDLISAVRAMIVSSTILLAVDRTEQLRQGGIAIATVCVAGTAALFASLWFSLWPVQLPTLLVLALIGMALAPHAIRGTSAPIYAGALSALWTLIGASADSPLSQTLYWTLLAVAGAAYAVGMQSLLTWFTERRREPDQSARGQPMSEATGT